MYSFTLKKARGHSRAIQSSESVVVFSTLPEHLRWDVSQSEYVKKEVYQWYAATVVSVEAGVARLSWLTCHKV